MKRSYLIILSKVYSISDDDFRELIRNNYCYSDILRCLGLNTSGGSSRDILKRRIKELNCSTAHFDKTINNNKSGTNFTGKPLEEILVEDSDYANIQSLKRRLIKKGLLIYKCAKCGIDKWNGLDISLQLHHKDGNNRNNKLDNLELLCPNCHSQTDNYAGKHNKQL